MRATDDEPLMHDHAELGGLLDQLIATLESNDVARTYASLDLFWARLAMHIRAEHLHLFEAILQAVNRKPGTHSNDAPSPDEAERTIEELREDHNFFMRELSQAVTVMRGLLANPEADAPEQLQSVRKSVDAVRQRIVRHNDLEEHGIYLWTKSLLSEAEQTNLAMLVNKELQNMPPRLT